jgi:hypothetical protein
MCMGSRPVVYNCDASWRTLISIKNRRSNEIIQNLLRLLSKVRPVQLYHIFSLRQTGASVSLIYYIIFSFINVKAGYFFLFSRPIFDGRPCNNIASASIIHILHIGDPCQE